MLIQLADTAACGVLGAGSAWLARERGDGSCLVEGGAQAVDVGAETLDGEWPQAQASPPVPRSMSSEPRPSALDSGQIHTPAITSVPGVATPRRGDEDGEAAAQDRYLAHFRTGTYAEAKSSKTGLQQKGPSPHRFLDYRYRSGCPKTALSGTSLGLPAVSMSTTPKQPKYHLRRSGC
jgi:hypothetical protein